MVVVRRSLDGIVGRSVQMTSATAGLAHLSSLSNIEPATDALTRSARVVQFQRNPFPDQFSIEQLFASLRESMRELGYAVDPVIVPYQSKGFWLRLASILWVSRHQGDV